MDDQPIVAEFAFAVHGATRDATIAKADDVANRILSMLGGEPWVKVDDDFRRMFPPERLTITDDQGFMYQGAVRYQFKGPLVESVEVPSHDGYRVQRAME